LSAQLCVSWTDAGRSRVVQAGPTAPLGDPLAPAECNAELFEAVLGYSRARGPGRLLLAAMAAVADVAGFVSGLSSEELCRPAGVADRTYRRARAELLASG
jgi:hypothetical protein